MYVLFTDIFMIFGYMYIQACMHVKKVAQRCDIYVQPVPTLAKLLIYSNTILPNNQKQAQRLTKVGFQNSFDGLVCVFEGSGMVVAFQLCLALPCQLCRICKFSH
jgi:hypothetical protein